MSIDGKQKGGIVMKWNVKNGIRLISPILVFPVLYIPYAFLNSAVIVDWLGCGCPKIDASGEMIHDYFSANDFTRIFWFVIAVGVTVLSWFLSKNILKKKWVRVLYTAGMFGVSLFVMCWFVRSMMWC